MKRAFSADKMPFGVTVECFTDDGKICRARRSRKYGAEPLAGGYVLCWGQNRHLVYAVTWWPIHDTQAP